MNITRITYAVCIHEWESICGLLYRNCFPKIKDYSRLRPYNSSHVHRKCGSITEMVQDRHVVTTHQ